MKEEETLYPTNFLTLDKPRRADRVDKITLAAAPKEGDEAGRN